MNVLWKITRNRYLVFADIVLVALSYVIAVWLRQADCLVEITVEKWGVIAIYAALFAGFLYLFGCYRVCWMYAGTKDYCRLVAACICASLIIDGMGVAYIFKGFSIKINIAVSGISAMGIMGMRLGSRALRRIISISNSRASMDNPRRVLIIGAGSLGVTLARDISSNQDLNYYILGFVDDDKRKKNIFLQGLEVLGSTDELKSICNRLEPDEIIFAISSATPEEKKRILNICAQTHCTLKIISGFAESLLGKRSTDYIRKVDVEDLLGRDKVELDNSSISGEIKDKVILVTGGGGSIGSELCRQIMKFSPKKLVVLDIYENNAFDLQNELADQFPGSDVDIVIASVRDEKRMGKVFEEYKPYMVFHAAAHKHVPMMESNAMEAVKNNVFGTWNTAQCASRYNAKRFVLISTDKAVNPTNIMGATKRICEMIVQAMQTVSKTEFVAVRFGNVLNSNGSVVPRFKKQISNGGPVTVTHPDIIRFFMTIPEAAQLVLQAASFAKGGEIFVLDMGEPIRIYDMAKNLIRLSGLRLGKDIEIVFSGLRPGEKLYEELLMDEEGLTKTAHNKIYIGKPFLQSIDDLKDKLKVLETAVATEENDAVRAAIAQVVSTYHTETVAAAIEENEVSLPMESLEDHEAIATT